MSENLIPHNNRSKDEARENGKKGGQASGAARRKKKAMREAAELILSLQPKLNKKQSGMIQSLGLDPGEEADVQFIALMAVAAKAMKGDLAAIALLRDTAGEKPVEKHDVSGELPVVIVGSEALED